MSLSDIIPPEINDDELADEITKLVKIFKPKVILEIGSSSGEGSTQAFIRGISSIPEQPCVLYCIEASDVRYKNLVKNVMQYKFVKSYFTTSVKDEESMSVQEIKHFFGLLTGLIDLEVLEIGEERVIKWLEDEQQNIDNMQTPRDGIRRIKKENEIDVFDMVLIDGSPFTAMAEMSLVYGSSVIIMDDIMGLKCYETHMRMKKDKNYMLYKENKILRNGYSVWIHK